MVKVLMGKVRHNALVKIHLVDFVGNVSARK